MTNENVSAQTGFKAAFIIGIVSICTFFLPALSIGLAILAIVLGVVKKEKKGLIFGGIGLALSLVFILFLSAFSEPTLDCSSDEAVRESIIEMTADMTEEEKARFIQTLSAINLLGQLEGEDVEEILDGMTVDEIYALAEEINRTYR